MTEEIRVCHYELCGVKFVAKTHNMKYCSDECCKLATNRRIMRKYYESKARKAGAVRKCDCGTILSRYNEKKICSSCEAKMVKSKKQSLIAMLSRMEQ